jgi:hypothetical protein
MVSYETEGFGYPFRRYISTSTILRSSNTMNESNSNSDPDVNPTGSKTIKDPLQDPRSPFFLHPSKNLGVVLVSTPLTDHNYHNWSRAMKRALSSKEQNQVYQWYSP